MTHALMALALLLAEGSSLELQVAAACRAPVGSSPLVRGIEVEPQIARLDDLPFLKVVVSRSGAWMNVYFDDEAQQIASARATCLGGQIALLEREMGDTRADAHWDDVVFTSQRAYAPPRGQGVATRWLVHTPDGGAISAEAQTMISLTLPHEQAHSYQSHAGARLPRWFSEGHATWAGLKVTAMIDPEIAATDGSKHEDELAAGSRPLALGEWGSVRPKREAILRQLTPEDRRRAEVDPSFMPSGSFQFGPDDLIGDESNSAARYAGAWKIFLGLEERHGADEVRAWVNDLITMRRSAGRDGIANSAQARFNEDLNLLLE